MRLLLLTVCGLAVLTGPARGVDYDKIDRPLKKEPLYRSNIPFADLFGSKPAEPLYGLLLFGPAARLRIWVVLDGDTLYIDRNGDGDLTGKGERFAKRSACNDVEIVDPDGKTRYIVTGIGMYRDGTPPKTHLLVNVDVKGPLAYRQYCDLEMRDSPRRAALAHFHGPLTAGPNTVYWKVPSSVALETGDKPAELYAVVGTMDAAHGCWVVIRSHEGDHSAFAKGASPVVDVEYPSKTAGGPPIKKRYALDKFC